MRPSGALVATALTLCPVSVAFAQGSPNPGPSLDRAVVRTVGTAVLGGLAYQLAAAALDSVSRPWTVRTPNDSSALWGLLQAHLMRVLRARVPAPNDTTEAYIQIETVEVQADSVFARFIIGVIWKCRTGQGGGSSTGYEVRTVWRGSGWPPPRAQALVHGDSMPCA